MLRICISMVSSAVIETPLEFMSDELDDEVDAGLAALLAPNVGKVLAGEVVEEEVEVREVDLLDGLVRYLVAVG